MLIISLQLRGEVTETGLACFGTSPALSRVSKNGVSQLPTAPPDLQTSGERVSGAGDLPTWVVEQTDYRPLPEFISIWLLLIWSPEEGRRWDGCHGFAGIQMAPDRRAMDALPSISRRRHSQAAAQTLAAFRRSVSDSSSISRSTLLPTGNDVRPVWEGN